MNSGYYLFYWLQGKGYFLALANLKPDPHETVENCVGQAEGTFRSCCEEASKDESRFPLMAKVLELLKPVVLGPLSKEHVSLLTQEKPVVRINTPLGYIDAVKIVDETSLFPYIKSGRVIYPTCLFETESTNFTVKE